MALDKILKNSSKVKTNVTLALYIFVCLLLAWISPASYSPFILMGLMIPVMISTLAQPQKLTAILAAANLLFFTLLYLKTGMFNFQSLLFPLLIFNIITILMIAIVKQYRYSQHKQITKLETQKERYRKLLESSSDGILQVSPEIEIVFSNAAYFLTVGYTPEDQYKEMGLNTIIETDLHAFRAVRESILKTGSAQLEYHVMHRNGRNLYRQVNYTAIHNDEGQPESFIATMRDITERKAMEEKLEYIAMHDQLTGLPNRSLIMDRLRHAVLHAKRSGFLVGLIFLDLDNFKTINDTLGHPEGDLFLQMAANRMERSLRGCDTIGRWSGDEFIIILENIKSEKDAELVADKLINTLNHPYERGGQLFHVTASLGLCTTLKTNDPAKMIECADQALYQSKREGKNRVSIY